ncbi:hypothetical protein BgiMline_031016 [Biomphalaria glabrata]|nr:hypothetical protein BgiMline_018978 [Biomphalaria glabrata]
MVGNITYPLLHRTFVSYGKVGQRRQQQRRVDTQTPTLLCQKSGHPDPNSSMSEVWTPRPQFFDVRSLDTQTPILRCQKSGHPDPNSLMSEVWTLRPQLFDVRSLDTQTPTL